MFIKNNVKSKLFPTYLTYKNNTSEILDTDVYHSAWTTKNESKSSIIKAFQEGYVNNNNEKRWMKFMWRNETLKVSRGIVVEENYSSTGRIQLLEVVNNSKPELWVNTSMYSRYNNSQKDYLRSICTQLGYRFAKCLLKTDDEIKATFCNKFLLPLYYQEDTYQKLISDEFIKTLDKESIKSDINNSLTEIYGIEQPVTETSQEEVLPA